MGTLFAIAVLAMGGIAVFSWYYSDKARAKRALKESPREDIASFREGRLGKIAGPLTYIGEPLRSPLTGRPCAYYEIHVEEYESGHDDDSGNWRTIIRDSGGQNFSIDDGSGRAIVNPVGATLAITIDSKSKSGTFDDPTPMEKHYLESHGREGKVWVFNKSIRYREGILEAGELVSVLGRATREPDPEAVSQTTGYRQAPPMRLRLGGSQKFPLVISDDPGTLT